MGRQSIGLINKYRVFFHISGENRGRMRDVDGFRLYIWLCSILTTNK